MLTEFVRQYIRRAVVKPYLTKQEDLPGFFVDSSVEPSGKTPQVFRGSWETAEFETLLRNAISWGTGARS